MSDLEDRLRTMLRERAGDVQSVPAHVLARPATRTPWRRRAGWLVAAAVALVLAVAAAVAVSGERHRSAPPATHPPTVRPTVSTVDRVACKAPLPRAWTTALRTAATAYGASSALPLAVSADGARLLVGRDFAAARDVVLVDARGHVRSLYSVPQPDEYQVVDASIDGQFAALDVDRLPRNSNGVIPTVSWLVLVDLRSGHQTVIDHTTPAQHVTGGRTIFRSVLWNGTLYWDVRPHFGDGPTAIRAYSIATRKTRTVAHADPYTLRVVPGGLTWAPIGSSVVTMPRPLPAAVPATDGSLVTDGTSYAWKMGQQRIAWWAPGETAPRVVRVRTSGQVDVSAVAGRYVFFADGETTVLGTSVLDAKTGATAFLRDETIGPLTARGTLVGYRFTGAFKESATAVVRVDTSALPELRC